MINFLFYMVSRCPYERQELGVSNRLAAFSIQELHHNAVLLSIRQNDEDAYPGKADCGLDACCAFSAESKSQENLLV